MELNRSILVAGQGGLVGSAIVRTLRHKGYSKLLLPLRNELEMRDQSAVRAYFERCRPDYVFLAAARVGGILANATFPAEFLYDNLGIQTNIIDAAYRFGTKKLLFLGSSCIYPRLAPQPMSESHLLTGELEPTNEWYAIAKIAGIKMCQAYRKQYGFDAVSLMPTNLYGPGDNFDPQTGHVIPALIRKFVGATVRNEPEVVIWGSGSPRREFLHVDDLADAAVLTMQQRTTPDLINVGTGQDLTIRDLAETIARVLNYRGKLRFDTSKPDGTPRKLLDISRITEVGWKPRISLEEGLRQTIQWFTETDPPRFQTAQHSVPGS